MAACLVPPCSARCRNPRERTGRHVFSVRLSFLQSQVSLDSLTLSARNIGVEAIARQRLKFALAERGEPCGDTTTWNERTSRSRTSVPGIRLKRDALWISLRERNATAQHPVAELIEINASSSPKELLRTGLVSKDLGQNRGSDHIPRLRLQGSHTRSVKSCLMRADTAGQSTPHLVWRSFLMLNPAKPRIPAPNMSRLEGSGTLLHLPGSSVLYAKVVPPEPCVDPSTPRVAKGEGRPNCVSMLMAEEHGDPQPPTNQATICPPLPVTRKILRPSERLNVAAPSDITNASSGSVSVGVPIPPYP
jgi:hypothetical protein